MQVMPTKEYKVLVRCLTYNHSKFINLALKGFVSQITSFPYICAIMDDASTDGNQIQIKNWIKKECEMEKAIYCEDDISNTIIIPHRVNKQCTLAFYFLKKNLYHGDKRPLFKPLRNVCQYEALCEGDDYWTDNNKLQRQVDFLDKHPTYSMIAENGLVLNEMNASTYPFSKLPSRDILSMEEMIQGRKFPTAGVLMRMEYVLDMYNTLMSPHDTFIWCWIFSKGKIRYNEIMSSVYRRGLQGVCESTEHYRFGKMIEKWDLDIGRQFNIPKKFIDLTIAKIYGFTLRRALHYKQYKSAAKSMFRMFVYMLKWIFGNNKY